MSEVLALALLGGVVYFAVRHIITQPALPKRGDPAILSAYRAMTAATEAEVTEAFRKVSGS